MFLHVKQDGCFFNLDEFSKKRFAQWYTEGKRVGRGEGKIFFFHFRVVDAATITWKENGRGEVCT